MACVGPLDTWSPRDVSRPFLPRGRTGGRTYKRLAVRVDNNAALVRCFVDCLASVFLCSIFSYSICCLIL